MKTPPIRALILDDDIDILNLLEIRLRRTCPEIQIEKRTRPDPSGPFDVYLIDNDFEGAGLAEQLAAKIRMQRPHALVIAISSSLDANTLRRLINIGCDGACDKSNPDEIAGVLDIIALHSRTLHVQRTVQSRPSLAETVRCLADLIRQWNGRLDNLALAAR